MGVFFTQIQLVQLVVFAVQNIDWISFLFLYLLGPQMFLEKVDFEGTRVQVEKLEARHRAGNGTEHGLRLAGGRVQFLESQGCSHGFPREKGAQLSLWIF